MAQRSMGRALCMDIGGGHVTAATVDAGAKVIVEGSVRRCAVDADRPAEELIRVWAETGMESLKSGGVREIGHVGIAMPAPFDYDRGISRMEHKFGALHGRNVGEMLAAAWKGCLKSPILFANDADLFTLGEWWAGAGRGCERVLGVTLGTGLGSGFVENGRIVTDDARIPEGGELWNVPFGESIAERAVSGTALSARFRKKTGEDRSAEEIAAMAYDGVSEARSCFAAMGRDLGDLMRPWVRSFQPEVVVCGGNLSRAFDLFEEVLAEGLGVRCVQSAYFDHAGLLGGAVLGSCG